MPAANMGIFKMQADGSRVSTVVILLDCISSLTLSIWLRAYHHLLYLYSAAVSRGGRNSITCTSAIPERFQTFKRHPTLMRLISILTLLFTLAACFDNNNSARTNLHTHTEVSVAICDTAAIDRPETKNYKKALSVWLETTSLDWFLEKRQSVWREAKAWRNKIIPIDSNTILKCLAKGRPPLFLYIPHQFYDRTKNGNEFIDFFIVNNSIDTVPIPQIDAVINNISSSVSYTNPDAPQDWIEFQQTAKDVECGNSFWTMKLPPGTAIKSQIESDYLNLGDTTVNYRLELTLDKQRIVSNTIKVNLMKKQLQYLRKPFD